jgi:hypothetical protein
VREVVIVISDLYVSQEEPEQQLPAGVSLPGLAHVVRFGTRVDVGTGGWRSWLASRVGAPVAITSAAPATVAALAVADSASPSAEAAPVSTGAWLATPVHLLAGLTSVHADRRSVLHLPRADMAALEADFQRTFADTGFALRSLESGDFLLLGNAAAPQLPRDAVAASEPARFLGQDIAHGMRGGVVVPALRRLGGELEMWLHAHPVNDARRQRGEPPVTGLWLWGEGAASTAAGATRDEVHGADPTLFYGTDAYLQGLSVHLGAKVSPLPSQLADVFSYPLAQRAVLVIEIAPMLHSKPEWSFFDALMQIDRKFMAPAVRALGDHKFEELVVVANDRQLTLRARDRFKLWRQPKPGLAGLQ